MASGEKESGLAKKILDAIKYIANDVILLFQQIRDYEEKQELAILLGGTLAIILLVKYLWQSSASRSVTESNANIRNYQSISGGIFNAENMDQVATGDFPKTGNGQPVHDNIREFKHGAKVNVRNMRQIAGGNLNDLQNVLETKEFYPLAKNGEKEGVCLILNYFKYENAKREPRNRIGTMEDAADLIDLFSGLNYDVMPYTDLSLEKTREKLKEVAKLYDQRPTYCSFVLCILAHGIPDHILIKNYPFAYQKIFSYFTGPSMVGKPKLFFIEACQGEDDDPGVVKVKSIPSTSTSHPPPLPDITRCADQTNTDSSDSSGFSDSSQEVASIPTKTFVSKDSLIDGITPKQADRFVFRSCYPGQNSVRLVDRGTLFIQNLVAVFKAKAHFGTELNELCIEVKNLVRQEIVGQVTKDGKLVRMLKQVPTVEDSLTKHFRFAIGGRRGKGKLQKVLQWLGF